MTIIKSWDNYYKRIEDDGRCTIWNSDFHDTLKMKTSYKTFVRPSCDWELKFEIEYNTLDDLINLIPEEFL